MKNNYLPIHQKSILHTFLSWLVILLPGFLPVFAQAQTITGTVYRDFNEDGTYTVIPPSGTYAYGEPGVAGIVVTAYPVAGAPLSVTTSATGSYTLVMSGRTGPFRVEFTNVPGGQYDGTRGSASATSVQFLGTASTGGTANFGLNLPEDYCQSNPKLVVPCYENGSGASNTNPVVVSLNYTATGSGQNVYPTNATADAMGSTWGVAYDKQTKLVYLSAFLKRQAGLGDRGLDGIYVIDYAGATPVLVGGFDLDGVVPSNGGSAISFGSVTRVFVASGAAGALNELSADRAQPSRDDNAYAKVGKVGYGDIDIDQATNTLWAVNLNERSLIAVDISSAVQGSTIPTTLASAKVKRYFIDGTTAPFITGLPSCPSGTMRPFGLKIHNGIGYLGVVCDGSALTTIDMTASQQAYVLSFNPANPTTFTQVTSVPLNYNREQSWVPFSPTPTFDALESDKWQRWIDTYTDPTAFGGSVNSANQDFKTGLNGLFVGAPQPILADIEFLPSGDMVLGFIDRFAHQQGWYNYIPGATTIRAAISHGDILLADWNGSNYSFEGPDENDNFTTPPVAANAQPAQLLTDGPSGAGEFFYKDYYVGSDASHPETALGGLSVFPGSNEVTAISFDPTAFNSMGIRWFNSSTGNESRNYTVAANTDITNFGKGSGLGDVELLCNIAPIQIGNRVWVDTDNDGVQDPSETPLAGVVVTLKGPGLPTAGVSVTTNSSGEYYFSNATGTNVTGFVYSLTSLTSGASYSLSFPTSASAGTLNLSTKPNSATGSNADAIDTDPNAAGVLSFTLGQAGENNFTYDAAYVQPAAQGDFVWFDTNANGQQDPTETGVPNVAVQLYDATTNTVVASTTTSASGLYSFTNLTPGAYYVQFTAPANTTFSTPNTGADATDSDVVSLTGLIGRTGTYTLTAGQNNTTVDAGFVKPLASLGDFVFEDVNRDGLQDGGDLPIQGAIVTLLQNGSAVATTTTSASGLYSFTSLTPGIPYSVSFTTPAGFQASTSANVGSNDAIDSDPVAGVTAPVTLTAGENNITLDAGFVKPVLPALLGDLVFEDVNKDGLQDAGDLPIQGAVVTLLQNGSAVATTTTDMNGLYSFTGLTSGIPYSVSFTTPAGFSASTSANAGSDDELDSDPVAGVTAPVTLTSGENNTTLDAGFVRSLTVTPAPTLDVNKQVNTSKAALGDVLIYTVTLTNSSSVAATNIVVQDAMSSGLAYVPGSASTSTGSFSTAAGSGTWSIASLPANATATLTYSASVTTDGVVYNTASIPGDTAKVCTTVPIKVCRNTAYAIELNAPVGYTRYQWYLTTPSGTTLVSDVTATSLNAATAYSYTATQAGEYKVVVNEGVVGACPDLSCCPVIIEEIEVPVYSALPKAPTCIGTTSQANGQITLLGLGADPTQYRYQLSPGSSFSAAVATPVSATAVPADGVIASNLTGGTYTVRVYTLLDGNLSCPRDVTVVVPPANCDCPTEICVPVTIRKTKSLRKTLP